MTSVNSVTGNSAQVTTTAGGTQQATSTATTTVTAGHSATRPVDVRADGPRASEPSPAGRAELPPPPVIAGPPDGPGFGQGTLDKCFERMDALEKEMAGIDPTSPQGSKRMMEIERILQRVDQLITTISNMRRMTHEMNMNAIRHIVS